MRHQVAGYKFGRNMAHRKAMIRNMVTSLILRDRIETTLTKAKELRRWADKMITLGKKGSIDARRRALMVLRNRDAVQKLFTILVDRFRERQGGYTRIIKLGFRHGDDAPMAVLEYLTAEVKKAVTKKEEPKKREKLIKPFKKAKGAAHPGAEKVEKKARPPKVKEEARGMTRPKKNPEKKKSS